MPNHQGALGAKQALQDFHFLPSVDDRSTCQEQQSPGLGGKGNAGAWERQSVGVLSKVCLISDNALEGQLFQVVAASVKKSPRENVETQNFFSGNLACFSLDNVARDARSPLGGFFLPVSNY